ncbi:MAG: SurA N-terminal domain-containing protein [Methyloligellaceae bacterium]
MLDSLRRGASSWVAKILIGLLVLSFAVWGVEDMFRIFGQRSLAKVGDTEISSEEYSNALQTELRSLGQRFGRTLTMEEARAIGLDALVLQRLLGNAAIEIHAAELKLGISDKAIADSIVSNISFRDATGRFNRQLYQQQLLSNGLNEQSFVAIQRKASLRRQLTRVASDVSVTPKTLLAAMDQFQNQTRVLRYFSVPVAKLGAIGEPSEEDLRKYYDGNKRTFTAPAFRKLGLLTLSPSELSRSIEIADDELRASYEANQASYTTEEKRRVLQISFPDMAAAEKAHGRLTSGADFMALAKELKFSESDVDLGKVTKSSLADPIVSEAAFKLKKDEISTPFQGQFGPIIVKVTEIEPKVVRTFDETKSEIRGQLAKERAANDILDLHDKIEDERAAGRTLAEIANKLSIKFTEVAAVDRRGNGPDGKPVAAISDSGQVLRTAFESDVGVENDPVETQDQGFVWLDVLGITPEKLRPFDTVRDKVAVEWRIAEERRRLAKKGQELVDRAKKGEPLEAIAKAFDAEVKQSKPLKRSDSDDGVPKAAVNQAFALSRDGVGSVATDDGKARVVFKVTKIEQPAPLNAERAKQLEQQLQSSLADDLLTQYVGALRLGYGDSINQSAYNVATGRESAPIGSRRGSF